MPEFEDSVGLGELDQPSAAAYIDYQAMLKDVFNVFNTNRAFDQQKMKETSLAASRKLTDDQRQFALDTAMRQNSVQQQTLGTIINEANKKGKVAIDGFKVALATEQHGLAAMHAGQIVMDFSAGSTYTDMLVSETHIQNLLAIANGGGPGAIAAAMEVNGLKEANATRYQKMTAQTFITGQSPVLQEMVNTTLEKMSQPSIQVAKVFSEGNYRKSLGLAEGEEDPKLMSLGELLKIAQKGNDPASKEAANYLLNSVHKKGHQASIASLLGGQLVHDPVLFGGERYASQLLRPGSPEDLEYKSNNALINSRIKNTGASRAEAWGMVQDDKKAYMDWRADGNRGPMSLFMGQQAIESAERNAVVVMNETRKALGFLTEDQVGFILDSSKLAGVYTTKGDVPAGYLAQLSTERARGKAEVLRPISEEYNQKKDEYARLQTKLDHLTKIKAGSNDPLSPNLNGLAPTTIAVTGTQVGMLYERFAKRENDDSLTEEERTEAGVLSNRFLKFDSVINYENPKSAKVRDETIVKRKTGGALSGFIDPFGAQEGTDIGLRVKENFAAFVDPSSDGSEYLSNKAVEAKGWFVKTFKEGGPEFIIKNKETARMIDAVHLINKSEDPNLSESQKKKITNKAESILFDELQFPKNDATLMIKKILNETEQASEKTLISEMRRVAADGAVLEAQLNAGQGVKIVDGQPIPINVKPQFSFSGPTSRGAEIQRDRIGATLAGQASKERIAEVNARARGKSASAAAAPQSLEDQIAANQDSIIEVDGVQVKFGTLPKQEQEDLMRQKISQDLGE